MDETLIIQAKKYDGSVRKQWEGQVVSRTADLTILRAKFDETVTHNDLGLIEKGTVSLEHFWFDRWYNVFRFQTSIDQLLAYYINIAMPARIEGSTLTYVDLDIDVVLWPDGRVEVLDRDDFEVNRVKYAYSPQVIANAEAALGTVLEMIESGEMPGGHPILT